MGWQVSAWRAVAAFRVAALGYAAALMARDTAGYPRPGLAWLVLAVMAGWTGFAVWAYAAPHRRAWPLLAADLAVAVGCLAATAAAVAPGAGAGTLTGVWVAAPVIAWAIQGGPWAGAVTALGVAAVDLVVRGRGLGPPDQTAINATVLLLLAGALVGYLSRLAVRAERQLRRAAAREAAIRERERLARDIHDSVLQVLALVRRRGGELGGEAARLGELAGEQEATLRALVAGAGPELGPADPADSSDSPGPAGPVDLAAAVRGYGSAAVSVAAPAEPVPLPAPVAAELLAAVGSALDNVRAHAGPQARAWVLVEAEPDAVTVTVRDDGPGIPDGRLAAAAAEGRLGIAQSIRGRLRDLGGTATVTSPPGQGTEVELRLPWSP